MATIAFRDDLRFEESVELDFAYTLADGDGPQVRVRPSVIVFPAWSFGTASEVTASRSRADTRCASTATRSTEAGGRLESGPIADPTTGWRS